MKNYFDSQTVNLRMDLDSNKVKFPPALLLLPSEHQHCQISLQLQRDVFIFYFCSALKPSFEIFPL